MISELVDANDVSVTESNLRNHFSEVEKMYNRGIYDKTYHVGDFVKATLLGLFYYEYNSMLERLVSACKLMQRIDIQSSPKFFDHSSSGLRLKDFLVEKL
ncbi:MAG: hypothetical protein FWC41_10550 [Firmicutes bacterium]|nr:hypothetical protein [Bacillota bacterium]